MRAGIVGGGAAGLAAAYDLAKEGHEVVVHERAPFLGGQASTFNVGGAQLERGYHHLFKSDTDILELAEEIGLGDRVRWVPSSVGTLADGRIYDFVTPLDLLRFTPISLLNRVRLGLSTLQTRRISDWRALESHTAVEWLRRKAGQGAYDAFWGPMLRGKFGEHFQEVGMAWVWGKVHTRFASRDKGMAREVLGYPVGSFSEIFERLRVEIEERGGRVQTSSAVTGIVEDGGRATGLRTERRPSTWESPQALNAPEPEPEADPGVGSGSVEQYDAIVATTPSYTLRRLAPGLPEGYMARLSGVEYMAAVLIILVLDRPLSRVYWLNVADRSIPFVGVIEQTNLIGPEHYGGKHIVYLSNYLTPDDRLYGLSHRELLDEYAPHLRKINPDFDASWVVNSFYHRVEAAQPVIGINYSQRIPDHRTPLRGLYLANTTQIYPEDRGTSYSVRIGRRVARMAMEDFG